MLKVPLVLAASLSLGAAAMAQTAADTPVASAADPALDAQISAYLNAAPQPLPITRRAGAMGPSEAPIPDRKVHGEVGAGIGTGGYREAYASMIAPVGQTGTVAVAVDQARGRGFRGGQVGGQSLSIAGAFGGEAGLAGRRPACAASKDKTDFEPLWVARMQAANPAAEADCRVKP
jgi:hypothetical protein